MIPLDTSYLDLPYFNDVLPSLQNGHTYNRNLYNIRLLENRDKKKKKMAHYDSKQKIRCNHGYQMTESSKVKSYLFASSNQKTSEKAFNCGVKTVI